MKVLFLSVTAGHGHNQAARVVMECLKERNIDCAMLDTFEYINPILSESIARGYLISTKFTPAVYGRLYRIAETREKTDSNLSITKLTNSILSRRLVSFLKTYDPDVIVCTHIFSAQIISHLRKKGLRSKLVGIITDFTIHPFWEDPEMDAYITANELLERQAQKKGIPVDRIYPLGIPINMKFSKREGKETSRNMLNIDNKDTILVMSGSMGYGNVIKIIQDLDHMDMDFQIISVCGNNKVLKKRIDNLKTQKKIYNHGFVDNVDVMMDAANCIVTKPGGLTVSESMAKGIPMILINPIPGQEDRNVEFLLNNGLAVKISRTFPVDVAVHQLLSSDWKQKYYDQLYRKIGRPFATKDLTELIIDIGKKMEDG